MRKRHDHISGGRCEPLIKCLELSVFRHFSISTTGNSKGQRYPLHPDFMKHEILKNRCWDSLAFRQPGIPRD
jgi:hypothetical protein